MATEPGDFDAGLQEVAGLVRDWWRNKPRTFEYEEGTQQAEQFQQQLHDLIERLAITMTDPDAFRHHAVKRAGQVSTEERLRGARAMQNLTDQEHDQLRDHIMRRAREWGRFDINDITFDVVNHRITNMAQDIIGVLSMLVDLGEIRVVSSGVGPTVYELGEGQPKIEF